ncbi:MAG TPA: helix-turn-helix transcriptional regulator, partial [Chondromyces sp.]|nr:helix-turn-helix transcriptional regulator [Chondromyces sp.]
MDIRIIFGQTIKKFRVELGISQEELALKSSLDRAYVGDVERGNRNISIINIHKITRALDIS